MTVTKHLEYITFTDNKSDCEEHNGWQEKDNVDCDPKFEASCSEFHLLTQGILNDLVHGLNLFKKKQPEILGYRLKEWNLIHQESEICSCSNRQNELICWTLRKDIPQAKYSRTSSIYS